MRPPASPKDGPWLLFLPRSCSTRRGQKPASPLIGRPQENGGHTGCGGDPPAPGFGPRSPTRSQSLPGAQPRGAPPGVPGRPPLALREWPRSPAGGQRRGGGQRMRRLSPGRGGRRALPDSGGRRPARYSPRAWRSRARSRPRAPGRASAAPTLPAGLSEAPRRRPLIRSQRSTIHLPPPPPWPPAREASPRPISARPAQPISARSTGGRWPAVPRATARGGGGSPRSPGCRGNRLPPFRA